MNDMDIRLIETSGECPEQYDAVLDGKIVGYLRLRHGFFRVDCPGCGGKTVYVAEPQGDGCFEPDEREGYLYQAKLAIASWIRDLPPEHPVHGWG